MKERTSIGIMKRLAMLMVPLLMVGALTVAAHANDGHRGHADKRSTKLEGSGIATMVATADDTVYGAFDKWDLFADNHFKIKGKVNADGSASGHATFVFGEAFSVIWGADVITLECEIGTGSVREDGTVVLHGTSFEEDFVDGVVTFEELSPFEIIVDPSGLTTLRWCQTPALSLEITKGHLEAK